MHNQEGKGEDVNEKINRTLAVFTGQGESMKSKNRQSLEVMKNLLGEDLFQVILKTFAGEKIMFPKVFDQMEKEHRNRCIKAEYDSGHGASVPDLMKKYDLSQSQIYKIIERTS